MRRPACTTPHTSATYFFLDFAVVELPGQLGVRAVVLRHHHQAGRAAVEPVHDARPQLAADPAQIRDLMEQGVDERALRVPRGGMHDHAGRLVDDDDVRILINDVELDRFGLRRRAGRLRNIDDDRLAGMHDAVWPHPLPVDRAPCRH